jgi:hypothetical protein
LHGIRYGRAVVPCIADAIHIGISGIIGEGGLGINIGPVGGGVDRVVYVNTVQSRIGQGIEVGEVAVVAIPNIEGIQLIVAHIKEFEGGDV